MLFDNAEKTMLAETRRLTAARSVVAYSGKTGWETQFTPMPIATGSFAILSPSIRTPPSFAPSGMRSFGHLIVSRRSSRGATCAIASCTANAATTSATQAQRLGALNEDVPLRDLAAQIGLRLGTAIYPADITTPANAAIAGGQFDLYTPANEMKWQVVEPNEGEFDWSGADNLVNKDSANSVNVTFDRTMQVSSFTPSQILSIVGPTGRIRNCYDPNSTSLCRPPRRRLPTS